MLQSHKKWLLISIIIVATLAIITSLYHQNREHNKLMHQQFIQIFGIPAPENPQQKQQLETKIRFKLIELKLRQGLSGAEQFGGQTLTQFPTILNLLKIDPDKLKTSHQEATDNFTKAQTTAQYFNFVFIETTPLKDLIQEYIKNTIFNR